MFRFSAFLREVVSPFRKKRLHEKCLESSACRRSQDDDDKIPPLPLGSGGF
ncbi:hypothetical protein ACSVDA_18100 [Cytobacillus sp. Hm23]